MDWSEITIHSTRYETACAKIAHACSTFLSLSFSRKNCRSYESASGCTPRSQCGLIGPSASLLQDSQDNPSSLTAHRLLLLPPKLRIWGSGVRISSGAPLRYRTGHSKACRFCARPDDERPQQCAFRPHDANFFRVHLDALGERAQVIATVAAAGGPHSFAGLRGERFEGLRRDARPEPIERTLGPLCVSAGLVADDLTARSRAP